MRFLALQVALMTALLAWRLARHGWPRAARRAAWVGSFICVATLPHTLWGWQVQQRVPLGYLRVQMDLATAWMVAALLVALGLWSLDALVLPRLPVNASRRRWLSRAPLALALGAPVGVAEAARAPEQRVVRLASPTLPRGFDGLRILQVSDLHLGPVLGLPWLEAALERAPAIDLVAVTGDLSDDLALIAPALARLAAVKAPLGYVAIPGNHEHIVGIDAFNIAVRASPFKLLTGEAFALERGGDTLQLLGIDYPHRRGVKNRVAFARMLDEVLARAGPGFRLLLSHHPDAFDAAAERGVELQLSGHTHGGQVEFLGRAVLAVWWLKYPRGLYAKGDTRMFVTTGLGHWLPFRVNCPTELPVIELVRG